MNRHQPLWARVVTRAAKPVDYVIDCLNLFRAGYSYSGGKWRIAGNEFVSRSSAISHMRDAVMLAACLKALKKAGPSLSGKSRNAKCVCGSGKKLKQCCLQYAESGQPRQA